MGKHVNLRTVDKAGLLRRYAALRGLTMEQAERTARDWTRSELRSVVEAGEDEHTTGGTHAARDLKGQTTTAYGYTR